MRCREDGHTTCKFPTRARERRACEVNDWTFFQEGDLMRAVRGLFCAVAITACLAPGVRADEYTKQTFLTFSGPVQLPGITLAAGTYQFRLADPESGRRALQVWDKDGNKLYATLLTIPD